MFNNPWVTGIGGGIISSLVVFFVTRYFFSKREKREYLQKIETANNEILYSVRPLVIEKKVPTIDTLSAIRISTAKKYGVKQDDLYNEFSLSNDLINEIMGNSFLSADQKIEFCTLLQTMKADRNSSKKKEVEVIYIKDKDSISSRYNSILLATMSFAMVMVMTFYITSRATNDNVDAIMLKDRVSLLITAIIIPLTAIMVLYLVRLIRDKEKDREFERKLKSKETKNEDETTKNIS